MSITLDDVVALCKRRGFVFPSCDIYGGLQGVYDYGPLGVELKNNLKNAWWTSMVYDRDDVEGLDSSILGSRWVYRYSGHENTFSDPMVDCRVCQNRMRADHVQDSVCSSCGSSDLTPPRDFNLMFRTQFGPIAGDDNIAYLRPETAQGIFIQFKNILNSRLSRLPFGVAQIGKAFRNEITARQFVFRVREFEQMELEFFVRPGEDEEWHERWVQTRLDWWMAQGLAASDLQRFDQPKDELAHYSKGTVDILYRFPHGFEELEGIANRSDFDLGSHSKNQHALALKAKVTPNQHSTAELTYTDPHTKETFVPYVIEPSAGVDRGILAVLSAAYTQEEERLVLRLKPHLAPIKAAVIPLARNRSDLMEKAEHVLQLVRGCRLGRVVMENTGNIGKNYRRHDEIGTPFCVTVDFDTLEDQSVTVRDRDTMQQERISMDALKGYMTSRIHNGNGAS